MIDEQLHDLEQLLDALDAQAPGEWSVEAHGAGEALFAGRTAGEDALGLGALHGYNLVHLTDPASQWPAARALMCQLRNRARDLIALARAGLVLVDHDDNGLLGEPCTCGDCIWCDDRVAIDAARATRDELAPRRARRADLSPCGKSVDPRFVEVQVAPRTHATNGPRPRSWQTWGARFAWRRGAHGGAAAEAETPERALQELARRARLAHAPWQQDGRAVEVLVRVEPSVDVDEQLEATSARARSATGRGATLGEAIEAALASLGGGGA